MQESSYERKRLIVTISIALLFISVYLFTTTELAKETPIGNLVLESVNIQNISVAKIAYKDGSKKEQNVIKPNKLDININQEETVEEEKKEPTVQQMSSQPVSWQLPTKHGVISQYTSYYHVALDITSGNGIYETIYPVAPGTVSSIYYDSAGAKIVTIHHYINGKNYTSQYVHLSSYANGLYVGKYLNVNDPIGQMGATGVATGVHLHLTVADCVLFDPNDYNCKDLNGFFRYIKIRHNQGFKGLQDLTYVPHSW